MRHFTHIQNTTFGGIRGFTRKPATPFTDDAGNFAGIVHQERNWTYALIAKSGHEVPEFTPEAVRSVMLHVSQLLIILFPVGPSPLSRIYPRE